VHPLKQTFRSLGIRIVDMAAWCNVSSSTAAHWMGGYRRPNAAMESRLQALAAKAQRDIESLARTVAEHGE